MYVTPTSAQMHDSRNNIFLYHLCMSVVKLLEHIHVWTILHRVLSLEIFLLIRAERRRMSIERLRGTHGYW